MSNSENSDKPRVWYIYGKAYDLTKMLDVHPGGR